MSFSERLAKLDRIARPIVSMMSPRFYIDFYSRARRDFLQRLSDEEPHNLNIDSWIKPVKLWDIEFNSRIFNAAGMFKNGKGYKLCACQGAGAWLSGTSTTHPRAGNRKTDILHPFLALPRTASAINWLGLPNDGHEALAGKIRRIEKIKGCPIGSSVSSDPTEIGIHALKSLIDGMNVLVDAGTDFIELNESCPNTEAHKSTSNSTLDTELINRLQYISEHFLNKRNKNIPVIVKLSVDTDSKLLHELIPLLVEMNFDGINLGNTSTTYKEYSELINPREYAAFKYFTENFGGGISGKLIGNKSLSLCQEANKIIKNIELHREFHIVRTGGIESTEDIRLSLES
ncbi:MAG: hypothetical protein RBT61_11775, partial [Candidatus Kapabacteria bacterium]|nr:hypothetical protein [Candidatus Kapabacteria bacterium]